ncbi:MAG: hypothetical protein HOJ16_06150, partial [Candidatus Peribacter sp.]|nr:hypothetical protein [Candidatus Peribacter sp.]
LGNNVQINLDDLTSDAREGQPPKIGYEAITFSNGETTTTHEGRPDWGTAKIVDTPPWTAKQPRKKWVERREMPHYGVGRDTDDSSLSLTTPIKYINEDGAYDTINLNYRDLSDSSYYGMDVVTNAFGEGNPFTHGVYPHIAQSVPRSVFQTGVLDKEIFPFLYQDPFVKAETTNDLFNSSSSVSLGMNSGEGTSSLGVRDGHASISLSSPFSTQTFDPNLSQTIVSMGGANTPITADVGISVSGLLFPADRGVLALIRFPSDADGVAQGITTAATTLAQIEERVISAINLGQGAGVNDGMPGGSLFNNSENTTFPSRITGQYDLYELHTGNYVPHSTNTGAIGGGLTADTSIGRVRLLTTANAFVPTSGSSTRPGGIPVLFSPYEKHFSEKLNATEISFANFYSESNPETTLGAYAIDDAGVSYACTIDPNNTKIIIDNPALITQPTIFYAYVLKENRSFLSYRLPVLKDYSPNGLPTPYEKRDRFFIKNKPNRDESNPNYEPRFETAGGFITFGEKDNYSYQVARYRSVSLLLTSYLDNINYPILANDDSEPEYNLGSFALIHFKTEKAFEALVRDGIAPSDSDVYSTNLLDYNTLNNNLGSGQGTVGGDGLEDSVASFQPQGALSVFRPNLNFEQKLDGYPDALSIKTYAQSWGLYPTDLASDLKRTDTYFMWASGVVYVNPTSWRAYKGHPSATGGVAETVSTDTQYSRFHTRIEITGKSVQGTDNFSQYDQTTPTTTTTPDKPFYTVRPSTQILTSELTASDNLFAGKYGRLTNSALTEYTTEIKHQQSWITISGLDSASPALSGDIVVIPKGDCVKGITDLTKYDTKEGLCTFTTVGLRPSVMVNKPHRQFNNIGVEHIKDDLNDNSGSTIKKLLYHSARKISLLELYGERFTPTGLKEDGTTVVDEISDIYTVNADARVGEDYRSNGCFLYCYLWSNWINLDATSQIYTPKSSGQAFSIYRYDEEGYKVYQELELLPIGGVVVNGYALELCSGWDWVKNTDGTNAGVHADFKYQIDRPVYRPVSNTHTRVEAKTHADAKFLAVKDVEYFIECHPSIPYDWTGAGTNPSGGLTPPNFAQTTEDNHSILLSGVGSPDATADLHLGFGNDLTTPPTYKDLYESLGDGATFTVNRGEAFYSAVPAVINCEEGATAHLHKIKKVWGVASWAYTKVTPHPHPTTSVKPDGDQSFGISISEVSPTGKRELPEYGNYTMDIKGFITVSGMGNPSVYSSDQLHATTPSNEPRHPLVSLFTPRKDTQERFLDESYRIEHSLNNLLDNNDEDSSYVFGNHSIAVNNPPTNGDTDLRTNLQGDGIPNFGVGFNGGYISFAVRDEPTYSPKTFSSSPTTLTKFSFHGFAGYLRNSLHMRRFKITSPPAPTDWLEAQVSGFPNMTRNHLSGSKYGTPARGVLIYPYQNFDGNTTIAFGYDLSNSGQSPVNPLVDSQAGFYLPNSNAGLNGGGVKDNDRIFGNHSNWGVATWIDDAITATDPILRHAQPDYTNTATNNTPDIGYLRAFDLNFGKSVERTPQMPYWDTDWTETPASGGSYNRTSTSADIKGQIESGKWTRVKQLENGDVKNTPIKLRLVGVDWDMISYVDPQFPTARRDGTVYTIDTRKYLMRKRVMRIFVKVPGLTTWLDVGVMNGEVGESYVQYKGDPTGTFGGMNENGVTSDKTHPSIDGAGCCVSYKQRYLVEEGLVCLDLELDVGFVPAFSTVGDDSISSTTIASYDEFMGQKTKTIYAGNSIKHHGDTTNRAWTKGGKEAPILVKVVLGNPDFARYEVHPSEATALINRDDLLDVATLIANVYGGGGDDSIYDIWPSPNKSYRGHSFPPDDRAPTWSRRGLMGIEVLRPDGSNFDHDPVIDRPDFADLSLFGKEPAFNGPTSKDDRTHYMLYRTGDLTGSGYLRGSSPLEGAINTNKQSYTFDNDMMDSTNNDEHEENYSLSKKGEG